MNGQPAVNHSGGHLPFEADITSFLSSGQSSFKIRVVVAVNNTLTPTTLPPGELVIHSPDYRELKTEFDFFNYAGIDRSVILYSTPKSYIQDILIGTETIEFDAQHVATSATLNYNVTIGGTTSSNALRVLIQLLDANGVVVANNTDLQSSLQVNKPELWWPCGMNHTHPCIEESYLYTLQVTLYDDTSEANLVDVYRIRHVGIRTIRLTDSKFLVNEGPFYFHGANAYEDSDIRGKGFDQVILTKHFNLYGWLHGNAFRTSHYPYADEFYYMADRFGIAIIGETPAAGLRMNNYFSQATFDHHKQVIAEMINRDRNHPAVLMWSVANEPHVTSAEAKAYFSALANFTKPIAGGRPITYVYAGDYKTDQGFQFFDMICINRYYGWYSQSGRLDQVAPLISEEIAGWRKQFPTKPILISEYGAETISGLHNDPPLMFTEEYQQDFLLAYHASFDNTSSLIHPDTGFFVGELVWTMFDFITEQTDERVGGLNRKGLFTRQRQPKAAAFTIKNRYEYLESIPTVSSQ